MATQNSTMTRKEMERIKRTSLPPVKPPPRSPLSHHRMNIAPGGPPENGKAKSKNVK